MINIFPSRCREILFINIRCNINRSLLVNDTLMHRHVGFLRFFRISQSHDRAFLMGRFTLSLTSMSVLSAIRK